MTDKQIIIDGVDVTDCEYCSRYADTTVYNCDWIGECKEHPNCYYKQLKRKEQECEELKSDLTDLSKIIDCKNGTIFTFKEQLDQLKAENEELKKEREKKRNHYFIISSENARLEDEKARLGYGLNCKIEKLKQALKEIKEIADGMHDLWINKSPYTDTNNLVVHLLECELNRIRYKFDDISEVIDD